MASKSLTVELTNILTGKAYHSPGNIQCVLTSTEHASQPIDGGIGIAAPHGFVEGRDTVVVLLSRLIIEKMAPL